MGESVSIVLPIPDQCLRSNFKPATHRGMRARAAAQKRQRCMADDLARIAQKNGFGVISLFWNKASVKVYWYGRTKNVLRMDQDGAIFRLKGAADGLQDAGLIVNDNGLEWEHPVVFEVDRDTPRVELVVTRIDTAAAGRA